MPLAGFEPAIPVGQRPQTYVLDRSATGIGIHILTTRYNLHFFTDKFEGVRALAFSDRFLQWQNVCPKCVIDWTYRFYTSQTVCALFLFWFSKVW
jgi:thymidine kinase